MKNSKKENQSKMVTSYDYWMYSNENETLDTPDDVVVTCLMPTGVTIPLKTLKCATIQEIKEVGGLFHYIFFILFILQKLKRRLKQKTNM